MEHAQQIAIEDIYLQLLTINIYPNCELRILYAHARETLEQLADICVEMPLIPGDRYKGLYEVLAGNRTCCILQFDPLIETNAPFRLTLKPSVGGDEAQRRIQRVLIEIFGLEYERRMGTARITGFELIVNLSETTLDELVFYDETKRVSTRHYDEHGRVNGIQLGAATSDQQIIVTNNIKKEEHKGIIERKPREIVTGVRITAKVKAANTPIQSAFTMTNPFAALSIIRLSPTLGGEGTTAWLGFLDSCRYRGMQAALARIPKIELRKKFRSRISHQLAVSWWHPSILWAGFPSLVDNLGLLSAPSKTQPSHANVSKKHDTEDLDDEDYDDC
jgi:hypothetical protein